MQDLPVQDLHQDDPEVLLVQGFLLHCPMPVESLRAVLHGEPVNDEPVPVMR